MLEVVDARGRAGPVPIARPQLVGGDSDAGSAARSIVEDVRAHGDAALLDAARRFDGADMRGDQLLVDGDQIGRSVKLVRPELLDALRGLWDRLSETCRRQMPDEWTLEDAGCVVGELIRPLSSVGIYAPGGRAAYASSVIMAAAPARVAGVPRLAVATPPLPSGEVSEVVLAACHVAGIDEVYRAGGAQAVGALAFGTETVRPVDKIVGPGNVYVTEAKRYVSSWVGTDGEAGPTELAIVADATADARTLAADLVAQAEHGPHGAHVLITWSEALVESTLAALDLEVMRHDRAEDVSNALIEGGSAVIVDDVEHALSTANFFGPEHLQLVFPGARERVADVHSAGAVFVGEWSPVAAGDYAVGTNHILPSGGSARWRSGLGVHDFIRRIYVCELNRTGLTRVEPAITALAAAEGLPAHARSVDVRLSRRDGS